MKTKYIILLLITVLTGSNAKSQNLAGVFKTQHDYVNDNLSSVVDLKIKGNCFRETRSMTLVIHQGKKKTKYSYGEIYGYLLNGNKYRAVPKPRKILSHYGYAKIVENENDGLIIYCKRSHGHKMTHTDYYYSASSKDSIKQLTKKNLEHDFASYPKFINKVNVLAEKHMLHSKDSAGKYVLNHLFYETIKEE